MISKRNLKKLEGSIVDISWKDIKSEIGVDKKMLEGVKVKDFFVICNSYGLLCIVDNDGVILVTEDSDISVDYTAIPYNNIVNVDLLRYNE